MTHTNKTKAKHSSVTMAAFDNSRIARELVGGFSWLFTNSAQNGFSGRDYSQRVFRRPASHRCRVMRHRTAGGIGPDSLAAFARLVSDLHAGSPPKGRPAAAPL